jgi:hypothetical protein
VNSRYLNVFRTGPLIGDVSPYGGFRNGADAANVITSTPETGQLRLEPRKLGSQLVRRESLELCRKMRGSQSRIGFHEQVNVIGHNFQRVNFSVQFLGLLVQELPQPFLHFADQHRLPILRTPNKVVLERVKGTCANSVPSVNHTSSVAQTLDICKKANREDRIPLPAEASSSLRF